MSFSTLPVVEMKGRQKKVGKDNRIVIRTRYMRVSVILLIRVTVLIPITDKYSLTSQRSRNQNMKLLRARARRLYKDDWTKFDTFR